MIKTKDMKDFKNTKTSKILKKRWMGKDMETYFENKSKVFLLNLKK
jgi:hypothetical protein